MDEKKNITNMTGSSIKSNQRLMVVFGTRPEAIKLAPVIHELKKRHETIVVCTNQHIDLLNPLLRLLEIYPDYNLRIMTNDQTPHQVCSKILQKLDKIMAKEKPDLALVQGDTTTTLAASLAAFYHRIPVGHVEAGLRSGNVYSPFPEEMNRQLVSKIATFHFAATNGNRDNLLMEGIQSERIFVTGNPIVDALKTFIKIPTDNENLRKLIDETRDKKRILLTTHRRENFGELMYEYLSTLRDFITANKNTCLFFPVHLNPNVKKSAQTLLSGHERIYLLEPLNYIDFINLMRVCWLVVSDSGGVQEEAPTLGKPLLIIRENTERPETIKAGVAKLVGKDPQNLKKMLEENLAVDTWIKSVKEISNPFGDGKAARKILKVIDEEIFQNGKAFKVKTK